MTTVAETVLRDPGELGDRWAFDWAQVNPHDRASLIDGPLDRSFHTSGTTKGLQAEWRRSGSQLKAEVDLTISLLPRGLDSVHSTAPPTSLYGYIFTGLIGVRLGVPVYYDRFRLNPSAARHEHPLFVLVPVPAVWCRIPDVAAKDRCTIVHAGAPVSQLAYDSLSVLGPGVTALELFGSTETGLVAWRRVAPPFSRDAWRMVSDVVLVDNGQEGEQPLTIGSSRIGAQAGSSAVTEHTLDDWVERLRLARDTRSSSRVGASRVCKPGGQKIDLDALEATIASLLNCDAACSAYLHPAIGEHIELHFASAELSTADVRGILKSAGSKLAVVPSRIEGVNRLDRTDMGKLRRVSLPLGTRQPI